MSDKVAVNLYIRLTKYAKIWCKKIHHQNYLEIYSFLREEECVLVHYWILIASSWLKESLCKTGITSLFNGHSTWPASTIYDNVTGVSAFNIMKRGRWFKKFSKTLWKRCVIFLSYFLILFPNSPLNHFQSSNEQKKIWCGILHITFTCVQREDLVKRSPEKFTKNK